MVDLLKTKKKSGRPRLTVGS
jgi:hypothetical protein